MADPGARQSINLQHDTQLYAMLTQLGVELEPTVGQATLTRELAAKAGVNFDFLAAFAKLTRLEAGIGALDLLTNAATKPKPWQVKLGWGGSVVAPVPPSEGISHENADATLDQDEAVILKKVLEVLDYKVEITDFNPDYQLENEGLVRQRMADIAVTAGWLEPENIQLGLLGHINGMLNYSGAYFTEHDLRGVAPPQEFSCPYIPSMRPIEQGLFFNESSDLSMAVGAAMQSVVQFNFDGDYRGPFAGSGVIIKPQYILSCDHILPSPNDLVETHADGTQWMQTHLTIGDKKYAANLQLVTVPGKGKTKNPDLHIFYWPEMPPELVSLQVNTKSLSPPKKTAGRESFALGWQDFADKNPVTTFDSETGARITRLARVNKIVVGAGVLNGFDTREVGLAKSTTVALPGFSGGPTVNSQGELIGITVEMDVTNEVSKNPNADRFRVTGSKFYSMDVWWNKITEAIRKHQKSVLKENAGTYAPHHGYRRGE